MYGTLHSAKVLRALHVDTGCMEQSVMKILSRLGYLDSDLCLVTQIKVMEIYLGLVT